MTKSPPFLNMMVSPKKLTYSQLLSMVVGFVQVWLSRAELGTLYWTFSTYIVNYEIQQAHFFFKNVHLLTQADFLVQLKQILRLLFSLKICLSCSSADFHHLTQNFGNKQKTGNFGLTRPSGGSAGYLF